MAEKSHSTLVLFQIWGFKHCLSEKSMGFFSNEGEGAVVDEQQRTEMGGRYREKMRLEEGYFHKCH